MNEDRKVKLAKAEVKQRQVQHWKSKAQVGAQMREGAAPKQGMSETATQAKRTRLTP